VKQPKRRITRLPEFDYSQPGAYFITLRLHRSGPLLAQIKNDESHLTESGRVVLACWNALPEHYPTVSLDSAIVMPDHFHGIVVLNPVDSSLLPDKSVGAGIRPAPTDATATTAFRAIALPVNTTSPVTLSEVVRAFKSFSARAVNQIRKSPGSPLWQRGYYEHVVHNDEDLNRTREYIVTNPLRKTLRGTKDDLPDGPARNHTGGTL
jgi:REP element-mobilizing transposase RayT